jgi:carboxyl-terminal processing protease
MMLLLMLLRMLFASSASLVAVPPDDPPAANPAMPNDVSPEGLFTEAWLVVRSAFHDPRLNGVDWDAVREELLPKARAAKNSAEISAVINDALSRLHASHTHHYTQEQREYYELLDVFNPDGVPERPGSAITPGPVSYVGVGLVATSIDGRIFVADVYDRGPAARAGLLPGDEIVSVEGEPWGDIAPFRGRAGVRTTITIHRTADPSSRKDVGVVPDVIHPREVFLAALKASARVIERDGHSAAYVRVRSYAHPDYHEALKEILADTFRDSKLPLVLDLRGGWGGAKPSYMDIFNPVAPTLEFTGREGASVSVRPAWTNPTVMLIDEGSRSGKEVLAYAFKKHHVGRLVGQRTGGMVLAGTLRPLADGSLLYVAVSKVTVDGDTIEGVGVMPDVVVERKLPHSAGKDQQIDAAVREAVSMPRP